jgi:amidophosphoribosyltransferase
MPPQQTVRSLIAKMKIIPVDSLIRNKRLILIDDSIVRGTQLRETAEFLYQCGAREVHIRPACPPLLFTCPFLNFSRSGHNAELITRKIIKRLNPGATEEDYEIYSDPNKGQYHQMISAIQRELNFTSLNYNRLDDMIEAIQLDKEDLCTYCWNRKG